MKRSTIIKRIRDAGYRGLPLREFGSQSDARQTILGVANDGELVTYPHPVTGATWVRLPLPSDRSVK